MRISGNAIKWIFIGVVILWLAGFIKLPILNTPIFDVFGRPFTIHHLLILLLVGYAIRFLPGILQMAVAILLILWLISNFFFLSLGGLANIFFLIIIIAILFAIFQYSVIARKNDEAIPSMNSKRTGNKTCRGLPRRFAPRNDG